MSKVCKGYLLVAELQQEKKCMGSINLGGGLDWELSYYLSAIANLLYTYLNKRPFHKLGLRGKKGILDPRIL